MGRAVFYPIRTFSDSRVQSPTLHLTPLATKIQHPGSLNPWQQYRQACSLYSNTTRSSNAAWYQSALELDLQLHIRPDGPLVFSSFFNKKKSEWTPGPPLTEESLHHPDQFEILAAEIIKHAKKNGASSIGVILHIADEFATAELKRDFANPADLPDLRNTAVDDPISILEDSSISADQASWRVLPYPAAGIENIATTITSSRQFDPLLTTLREVGDRENFPIITRALSAPMVSLMSLPQIFKHQPDRPFVTILQYPWFTVLAFFNEHADLRLVRTLQHRGIRRAANFRNALYTTSASLEFLDPDLYIIQLGQDIDLSLETTLIANFAHTRVEVLEVPSTPGVPKWCPEPAFSTAQPSAGAVLNSNTFNMLRDDQWALQDFLPAPKEVKEVFPTGTEMRLLRIVRLVRVIIIALILGGLAFVTMGILDLTGRDEWDYDTSQAEGAKTELDELNFERQRIDHWNNLLADRSKAWTAMESVAQMFPQDGGMIVKNCTYTAKPDNTPGKSTIGFIRSWKIAGFAQPGKPLEFLNSLQTRDGINAHFMKVAALTGNNSFDMSIGNRIAPVSVRVLENNAYTPGNYRSSTTDESGYPYTFDLTITQRFEADDPIAISVPVPVAATAPKAFKAR